MNEDRNAKFQANRLGCQLLTGVFFISVPQSVLWWLVHSRWSRNVCGTHLDVTCLPVSLGQQSPSGQHRTEADVLPESGDHTHALGSLQVQYKDIFHHEETNQDICMERFQLVPCKMTLSPLWETRQFGLSGSWSPHWRIFSRATTATYTGRGVVSGAVSRLRLGTYRANYIITAIRELILILKGIISHVETLTTHLE